MPGIIPIDGELGYQSLQVTLDGVEYTIELDWNMRDSRWYLSLLAADGTDLVRGVAVTVDAPLLRRFVGGFPPGDLMALDTTEAGAEITAMEELGVRVQLVYLTEAEVAP